MPSTKKVRGAQEWAFQMLDEADDDKPSIFAQPGINDNGAEPSKAARELVKIAREETKDLGHHTQEDEDKFVATWEGVLTDASAIKSRDYVARAFGDAVAHGPKAALTRMKGDRDRLIASAKEWQASSSSAK